MRWLDTEVLLLHYFHRTIGDEDESLDVGALQVHVDGPTAFGVQSRYRARAREAFVRWDCGERVRRAALRKAAPVVGSYQVGDIVSHCREARVNCNGTASVKHNHAHVG